MANASMRHLAISILIGLTSLVASQSTPTVTIASGVVIGTATRVSNQPSVTGLVNAYLGVPFAKSPPERFSPPVQPDAWSTPLKAQSLKPACIQQFTGKGLPQEKTKRYFNNPGGSPPLEDEDCLYLNVHSPPGASFSNRKPVLFWLFGGNLQFGTGGLALYNGSSLAVNEDAVVVTPNYRTNIFGFSNSPEIAFGSQNSGFLDQRLALSWVQQNIAQFGGDPQKVTIFGESAGGESVKALLSNPPDSPQFAAAILESQGVGLSGNGTDNYNDVLRQFQCTEAPKPIDCLRQKSATEIKAYIESSSLAFPPVTDDGTYFKDIGPSIASGTFAKVPIFIGNNLNEARVFLNVLGVDSAADALATVFSQIGVTATADQQKIIDAYRTPADDAVYELADRIFTDVVFTCVTSSLSKNLALHGYNVWRYRFDGVFPNVSPFPNAGAWHSVEIPEVFGSYPLLNEDGPATDQQKLLSSFMQGVWAKMARDPSSGPGWPRVGSAFGVELGVLGANGSNGVNVVSVGTADYPCGIYRALGLVK